MDEGTAQALDSMDRKRRIEVGDLVRFTKEAQRIGGVRTHRVTLINGEQVTLEGHGAWLASALEKVPTRAQRPSQDLTELALLGEATSLAYRLKHEQAADLKETTLTDPKDLILDILSRENDVRDWPEDERELHRGWVGDFRSRHAAVIELRAKKILNALQPQQDPNSLLLDPMPYEHRAYPDRSPHKLFGYYFKPREGFEQNHAHYGKG